MMAVQQEQQQQQQGSAIYAQQHLATVAAAAPITAGGTLRESINAAAVATSTLAVPVSSTAPTTTTTTANDVVAVKAAALAAAAAQEKEAKRQAKQALSAAKKNKNQRDIAKWKSVQQEEKEVDVEGSMVGCVKAWGVLQPHSTHGSSSTSSSEDAEQQQQQQQLRTAPTFTPSGGRSSDGGECGGVGVAPLLALGTDYASIGKLRLLPEGGSSPGQPLAEGSGSKWACLVSRRAFASQEQLAKHVRVSELYREELVKAISEGRVVMASP
jgi:hypothetical protein